MKWRSPPRVQRSINRRRLKRCGYCNNRHIGECVDKHERRNFKVAREADRAPEIDVIELADEGVR